jgi:hypothetical protein
MTRGKSLCGRGTRLKKFPEGTVGGKLSGIFGYSSKSGSLSKSGLDADKQLVLCCFDFDPDFDSDPDEWLFLAIVLRGRLAVGGN